MSTHSKRADNVRLVARVTPHQEAKVKATADVLGTTVSALMREFIATRFTDFADKRGVVFFDGRPVLKP